MLVAEPGREVEAATRLGRIGFDTVAGYLAGGMQPVAGRPELVERIERITAGSLAEQLGTADPPPLVLDVRTAREWDERPHRRRAQPTAGAACRSASASCRAIAR